MNECAEAGFEVKVIFHCEGLSIARGKQTGYDDSEYYANIGQVASLGAMAKH
ncbi:hypothetical protein JMY85_18000 [Brenneria goodwinii]|uniref:Uncharacterized protein n=1 Tax=Brenneria goodwinii TaxID=1109412 RepID=A0A0G4K2L8_9GAMM|nr:hypothetical protein [Brenneria goodwinii]MCG8157696.1 hypothetical protein [Brenneria goodwinii]MCG8165519.1 hypothetical protein [Brenneria goodwinii]MCG8170002.1 hypothetical protein [Brenneria goodwinii]MCG8179619.1 hypothetical protein [Brenneria goodwinii]MCG8195238.1 hypothetical protein [Brenneria goodwinii]